MRIARMKLAGLCHVEMQHCVRNTTSMAYGMSFGATEVINLSIQHPVKQNHQCSCLFCMKACEIGR